MKKIIITDLTRFKTSDSVCTAGIDPVSGKCIRPWPYLKLNYCKSQNILPGAIIESEFVARKDIEPPHFEDMTYGKLNPRGPCSSDQFRGVLEKSLFDGIEDGFEIALEDKQKHIPFGENASRSIITILVDSASIEVVEDQYDETKAKLHFVDGSGKYFRYMPITDLGFHEYVQQCRKEKKSYSTLNNFISRQENVYLRIGLGRRYQDPKGRDGFWIQVNGVYTFPEFFKELRCHK